MWAKRNIQRCSILTKRKRNIARLIDWQQSTVGATVTPSPPPAKLIVTFIRNNNLLDNWLSLSVSTRRRCCLEQCRWLIFLAFNSQQQLLAPLFSCQQAQGDQFGKCHFRFLHSPSKPERSCDHRDNTASRNPLTSCYCCCCHLHLCKLS